MNVNGREIESTPNCPGQCQVNSLSCSSNYTSGLCPGANDVQCCPFTVKNYSGVDVSNLVSVSDFSCMNNMGYEFAIVRVSFWKVHYLLCDIF